MITIEEKIKILYNKIDKTISDIEEYSAIMNSSISHFERSILYQFMIEKIEIREILNEEFKSLTKDSL